MMAPGSGPLGPGAEDVLPAFLEPGAAILPGHVEDLREGPDEELLGDGRAAAGERQ